MGRPISSLPLNPFWEPRTRFPPVFLDWFLFFFVEFIWFFIYFFTALILLSFCLHSIFFPFFIKCANFFQIQNVFKNLWNFLKFVILFKFYEHFWNLLAFFPFLWTFFHFCNLFSNWELFPSLELFCNSWTFLKFVNIFSNFMHFLKIYEPFQIRKHFSN